MAVGRGISAKKRDSGGGTDFSSALVFVWNDVFRLLSGEGFPVFWERAVRKALPYT